MTRARRVANGGFLLISSYLMLFLFILYSNALTVQMVTQRAVADRAREQFQATDLAQGAMEHLGDELYRFLAANVTELTYQGNTVQALQWLDALGQAIQGGAPPSPLFVLSDRDGDGLITTADLVNGSMDGVEANPFSISLPAGQGRAWIVSIVSTNPADPLATRRLTLIGEAAVGSVTKRIKAVYAIELGMAEAFRYAYFVNNYGWFSATDANRMYVRGDIRSNGDLAFTGSLGRIVVDGDLYAAKNPELINPVTKKPAAGAITGDPVESADLTTYWKACSTKPCEYEVARPARDVIFPGQPLIGGSTTKKSVAYGWDSEFKDQKRFEAQVPQPIPVLGDLALYKGLAVKKGSTLTYYDSEAKKSRTINAVYESGDPLVLVGTPSRPIVLNGPVVIPGDVILKGVVVGRGTIYAGRNVHIVGEVEYTQSPQWARLERNEKTGRIASRGHGIESDHPEHNLGTVCSDGSYYQPGAPAPSGCAR